MNARTLSLITLFVLAFGSLGLLQWYSSTREPKPIGQLPDQIPMAFGSWSGRDMPIQEQIQRVLNAYSYVNRLYVRGDGKSISLHAANWQNPDTISAAPHHPEVCYAGAGWKILKRKMATAEHAGSKFPIELILFEAKGQRVVTAHWFQTGELRYANEPQFSKERHRFWGTRKWPGTEKFLMQMSASNIDEAEPILVEFSQELLKAIEDGASTNVTPEGQSPAPPPTSPAISWTPPKSG